MFERQELLTPAVLRGRPVSMPLDILLVVASDQSRPTLSFNVVAACKEILGRFGWKSAKRVLNPKVWAPHWDSDRFTAFAMDAGFNAGEGSELRAAHFLGLRAPFSGGQYEIVHFVGDVFRDKSNRPALAIEVDGKEQVLTSGILTDALVQSDTRLLILQTRGPRNNALQLAQHIGGAGGPAILVFSSDDEQESYRYLVDFYAGIVHNRGLNEIGAPRLDPENALRVTLFSSLDRDASLLFHPYLEQLRSDLQEAALALPAQVTALQQLAGQSGLHAAFAREFSHAALDAAKSTAAVTTDIGELFNITHRPWHHESEGAIPATQIAERLAKTDATVSRIEALRADIGDARVRPVRVLNAAFASDGKALNDPELSLVAGREYELLVDIGPRWNKIRSIVSGSSDFPEFALPTDGEASTVTVSLVSSDFAPHTVQTEIWLPSSGRSYQIIDGKRASEPGPASLRVRAPSLNDNEADGVRIARGRLCLYYRNDLLQSAIVTAPVSREPRRVKTPATVSVDYAMSATMHGVAERYGSRMLQLGDEPAPTAHPIGVSLMLNDAGNGTHRIVVARDPTQTPAWIPYDPLGATKLLKDARDEMLRCFYERDSTGQATQELGLSADNAKSYEQFQLDLFMLAQVGWRVYNAVFGDIRPESGPSLQGLSGVEWEREIRKSLERRGVIQVARADSAQYTFPFALMYEHPLTDAPEKQRVCKILDEWKPDGIRRLPPAAKCPYANDADHGENVICPYGFWGLRHVIEQPLSAYDRERRAPRDVATEIPVTAYASLAAGWTTDATLDPEELETHLQNLTGIVGLRLVPSQPNPANDVTSVRALLQSPSVVYFLCHGEYDSRKNEPYIGVGVPDAAAEHCVYPSMIHAWSITPDLPNLFGWGKARPLVIINGCHTADLLPGQILNFVAAFAKARASGVIGTEVSVRLPLATEVAEELLGSIARGDKVGQAVYDMRWRLANKGNLLGLAYTLYAMSNLHIARA